MRSGYNPNQPRVPAGNSKGGQWTSDGSGAEASARGAAGLDRFSRVDLAARMNLRDFEKEIVNQNFESAALYDYNQYDQLKFWKDGTEDSVTFSDDEFDQMYKAILTHNHPGGKPFSFDDVFMFESSGLQEMRAVTKDRIFIMQRPAGWWDDNRNFRSNFQSKWEMGNSTAKSTMFNRINYGDLQNVDDWKRWSGHWEEYAKYRGFNYYWVKNVEDR